MNSVVANQPVHRRESGGPMHRASAASGAAFCLMAGLIVLPGGCSTAENDPAADAVPNKHGVATDQTGDGEQVPATGNETAGAEPPAFTIALARAGSARDGAAAPGDRFEVRGIDPTALAELAAAKLTADTWHRLFAVRVHDDNETEYPPMLGEYTAGNDRLIFQPQFPLRAGVRYRAAFDPDALPSGAERTDEPASKSSSVVSKVFSLPAPLSEPAAVVSEVYPTADTLPENQLKFYIHFSAPMSRGEAYRRIHLLDAKGGRVPFPFLELDEELWDHTGTRFTLFIDPGRIKRGLKPREEVGPALEEGKSYTLVVEGDWLDADGVPMKRPFRKAFRVGPPDMKQPNHQQWKLTAPPAGTAEPLEVRFGEPLDHAMLGRVLTVTDAVGEPVPAGTVQIDAGETRWRFRPEKTWQPGEYLLVVDAALEDLAGNSIARPFEVDVFRTIQRKITTKTVSRSFTVQPATN